MPYFDYPRVPLDEPHTPSLRVSLNPQFLRYDPVRDSGINVGYNSQEQTVGIGESKRYLWYADREYGACILQSCGDLRNHRYHGLFGAVIVEPAGTGFTDMEGIQQPASWRSSHACMAGISRRPGDFPHHDAGR